MNFNNKISPECQEVIEEIDKLVTNAQEKIKNAIERANAAEQTLIKVKETLHLEIKKAYEIGYKQGRLSVLKEEETDEGGTGNTKTEDSKLVLEKQN